MNHRSSNTASPSHNRIVWRSRTWLLAVLLLLLTIGTRFVQSDQAFAQEPGGLWSGSVTDESGNPLPASVSINGVSVQVDESGKFEVNAPVGENNRNIINANLIGYASISSIHNGSAIQGLRLEMKEMQSFTILPGEPIEIEGERGTRISIPANGLIREADGSPANEPVTASVYTWDIRNEQMVGDMSAINAVGEVVWLVSYGAFAAEFRNEKGDLYNLAPGVVALISVPVPDETGAPDEMPLWYYNPEEGRWIEDGKAISDGVRISGFVSHFTSWNFDMIWSAPEYDLGDAPDSTNNFPGVPMFTYPTLGGILARFPTVYNDPTDPGPLHDQAQVVAWLGKWVTLENEADTGSDQDGVNNIDPNGAIDDLDQADDGIHLPLTLPPCGYTTLDYDVNTLSGAILNWSFNVWFDYNRDGDWEDSLTCVDSTGITIVVPEWAVQNQIVNAPTGFRTFTTAAFAAMDPATSANPMWMRATLTSQTAPPSLITGVPAGGGPAGGYMYGETEDYYLTTAMVPQ